MMFLTFPRCALRSTLAGLGLAWLGLAAQAQEALTVVAGEKLVIPIRIKTEVACNIEIVIKDRREQRQAEAPNFDINFEFQGQEPGVTDISWEGRFRSRGLNSRPACPGSGKFRVTTVLNTEQRKAEWARIFAPLRAEQKQCLLIGLVQRSVKFDSMDPQASLDSPQSPAAKDVFARCDSFFLLPRPWGTNNPEDYACTLPGGQRTRCTATYAERLANGQTAPITLEAAMTLHLEGKPWTTAQRENDSVREERERAVREAAEKERLYKESPEYKRQQAELERKRAAEMLQAEEKQRQERQAQELAARQKREEEERRQAERAERERQQREQFASTYPYYAVVTCGFQGRHTNVLACFAGRVGTEIELRNGPRYGLYKVHEIRNLGRESQEGLRIDLQRNFEIKAQNSDDTLVLGIKIIDRVTNETVFEKQVGRFGVISVRN